MRRSAKRKVLKLGVPPPDWSFDMVSHARTRLDNWPPVDRLLYLDAPHPAPTVQRSTRCATHLLRTGLCYWRTLASIPAPYRMSALEEVAYLPSPSPLNQRPEV